MGGEERRYEEKSWLHERNVALTFDEARRDGVLCLGGVSFAPASSPLRRLDGEVCATGGDGEERDLGLETHLGLEGGWGGRARVR